MADGPNSAKAQKKHDEDLIRDAIAEGRYQPEPDPRDISPHSQPRQNQPIANRPPHRLVGNLAWDEHGTGLLPDDESARPPRPDTTIKIIRRRAGK